MAPSPLPEGVKTAPDDDCDGCNMMQALTKMNKQFTSRKQGARKFTGEEKKEKERSDADNKQESKQDDASRRQEGRRGQAESSRNKEAQQDREKKKEKEELVEEQGHQWRTDDRPMDLYELGNATWGLLHTMAAYYPSSANEEKQRSTMTFLRSVAEVYPCKFCAEDWGEVLNRIPPQLSGIRHGPR